MSPRPFYYRETQGIRVTVRLIYLRDHSRPRAGQYVFAYFVRLENVGDRPAQLLSRSWLIHDSVGDGEDHTVEGEGVVGRQPTLRPGEVHEYQSYCVLKSPSGYMEGHYHFVRPDGSWFDAQIPRFVLDATPAAGPTA